MIVTIGQAGGGSGAYSSATLYGAFYGGAAPKMVVRKFVNQPLNGFGTDSGSYTVTLVSGDIVKIQAVGRAGRRGQ